MICVTKTVAGGGQSPNPLEGADKNPPEENLLMRHTKSNTVTKTEKGPWK